MIEKFEYSISTIRNLFHPFKYLEEDNSRLKYISTSSSMVEPGSLFVPLKGNRDGHEFIQDALGKGAISFLCEFNHPVLNSLPIEQQKKAILVDDTLLALGTLAEYHRKRFNPFVIGITGSSGKTTTKEFYKSCLNYFAEDLVFTEKNYNNEIGVPFTLFKISDNTRIVICEMGMNHRYEISRLTKMVKPNISVITNVGPAHIENLGSIKEIARAKAEILESMSKGSNLYIPENIEQIRIIRKKAKKYKVNVNTYSIENSKELKILEESNAGYLIEI
ncbi:MAG: UDP-N-acetylmuramoyl-tripeptide--D-alanyl-D-alanine ligase, partial [Leptospiraceae bacterium]|nr:UDP-N-acetylmuramoyl-tripeptide--D-alanyl-D-alanine ligase [Leptospiraceae bacterium]